MSDRELVETSLLIQADIAKSMRLIARVQPKANEYLHKDAVGLGKCGSLGDFD